MYWIATDPETKSVWEIREENSSIFYPRNIYKDGVFIQVEASLQDAKDAIYELLRRPLNWVQTPS